MGGGRGRGWAVVAGGILALTLGCQGPEAAPARQADPPVAPASAPAPGATSPKARSAPRPDLLLITLDTTRADHLSAYGYGRPTTPTLAALAQGGQMLTRLRAPVPLTTPSHATLMTGLLPRDHGVFANYGGFDRLEDDRRTLAEALKGAGYQTAASIGAYTAGRAVGLAQGFDAFFEPDYDAGPERGAEAVTGDALSWLKRAQPTPLFIWVHYFDAHGPYAPPPDAINALSRDAPPPKGLDLPPGARSHEAETFLYDAELRHVDGQLARVVAALKARGRPLIIAAVGDHGETLGERPLAFQHGRYLFEEQLAIPGILWGAGIPQGGRSDGLAGLRDVTQTLAARLGVGPLGSGRDLLTLAPNGAGGPDPEGDLSPGDREEIALAFSMPCDPARGMNCAPKGPQGKMTSLTAGRWKLIFTPDAPQPHVQLFRLDLDPGETRDLSQLHPKVTTEMLRLLDIEAPGRAAPGGG